MKKWTKKLMACSIILGTFPFGLMSQVALASTEESTASKVEVEIAEGSIAVVNELEGKENQKVIMEPRLISEYKFDVDAEVDFGVVMFDGIGENAYTLFNPNRLEVISYGSPTNQGGFTWQEISLATGANIGGLIEGPIFDIQNVEGFHLYEVSALKNHGIGLPDQGFVFYQILKTASEVKITGEDNVTITNGVGSVPVNPSILAVARPSSDTYGDATLAWKLTGPDGHEMTGNTAEELQAIDLNKLGAGTYRLENTVTETIPEGTAAVPSPMYGMTYPSTTNLLSTSATTAGTFIITKPTKVIVHHQFEDGREFAPDVIIDGFLGDAYTTYPVIKDDYKVIKIIGNTTGFHTEALTEVTYVYAKQIPIDSEIEETPIKDRDSGVPGTRESKGTLPKTGEVQSISLIAFGVLAMIIAFCMLIVGYKKQED